MASLLTLRVIGHQDNMSGFLVRTEESFLIQLSIGVIILAQAMLRIDLPPVVVQRAGIRGVDANST